MYWPYQDALQSVYHAVLIQLVIVGHRRVVKGFVWRRDGLGGWLYVHSRDSPPVKVWTVGQEIGNSVGDAGDVVEIGRAHV